MTLESALLKLDWADECIKVLEDEIRAFFENENYRVAANFNPDRISKGFTTFDGFVQSDQVGMWELSLQIRQEAPTRRWSLMVGDIVNNLRSCLNHCVYELAALASGQEPPPKFSGLKFLICRDEADFNGQTPKRLLNVPQGAVQVILSAQSFNDPQSALPILQSISNADKHHRIRLAVTFMREFSAFDAKTVGVSTSGIGGGYVHDSGAKTVHTLYDGFPISYLIFGTPEINRDADVHTDVEFEVVFEEGEPVGHAEVTATLNHISQTVRKIFGNLKLCTRDLLGTPNG